MVFMRLKIKSIVSLPRSQKRGANKWLRSYPLNLEQVMLFRKVNVKKNVLWTFLESVEKY